MKKYRIHYSFVKADNSVMNDQHTHWMYDREEANELWKIMKEETCYTNLKPETIDEETVEKHIVTVAFKTYDYIVEGPVKKGQFVEVISGGQVVKLKVLEVDPPKRANIDYKLVERVCGKEKLA